MFDTHQKAIGEYARSDAHAMARVYQFVLATIQQPLHQVPAQMADMDAHGADSAYAWGMKADALAYAHGEAEDVYNTSLALWGAAETDNDARDMLLGYFASLPGLGVVKGGFMVQLCFGLSGCIDSHNVKRYGVNPATFRAARFKNGSAKLRRKIIGDYHALIDSEGGSAALWDSWCHYVAEQQPMTYTDGFHVSRIHADALGLEMTA